MKITCVSQDTTITSVMRERVTHKFMKLDRYFSSEVSAIVRFKGKSAGRCAVEATLTAKGLMLRAEAGGKDNILSYVDDVADRLDGQIRKYRTKLSRRNRGVVLPDGLSAPADAGEDAAALRFKTYTTRPMSIEDAIMQMDITDHPFFIFINSETEEANAVYRRYDGSIGVLEPEH